MAEFDDLAALLSANHVLVGPMSADEYRRAIEGPVRRSGLRIEPALVDRLVADVVNQPGGLPLLSTALVELWRKRDGRSMRLETYEETGGVSGAVARLAESAYAELGTGAGGRPEHLPAAGEWPAIPLFVAGSRCPSSTLRPTRSSGRRFGS